MLNDSGSLLNGAALGSSGRIRTVALWTRGAVCSAVKDAGQIRVTQLGALRSVVSVTASATGPLTVYRRMVGAGYPAATGLGEATIWRKLTGSGTVSAQASATLTARIPVPLVSTATLYANASSRVYRAVSLSQSGQCSATGSLFLTMKGKVLVAMSGVATCVKVNALMVAQRAMKSTSQHSCVAFSRMTMLHPVPLSSDSQHLSVAFSTLTRWHPVPLASTSVHSCVAFSRASRRRLLKSSAGCQVSATSKFGRTINADLAPVERTATIGEDTRLMFASGD